jgi:hypothetical protein
MGSSNKLASFSFIGFTLSAFLSCSRQVAEVDVASYMSDTVTAVYRNGVYSATGEYGGLPSHIIVRLTLTDAIISNVDVTPLATDPTSLDYQRRFAAEVPAVVNGKHISSVKVSRLAGSSGTPNGFNHALEQIKAKAKM